MSKVIPDVAIVGKMGAGKSEIANVLLDPSNGVPTYEHVAIAGELKRIAVEIFGPGADKDRRILQGLGAYVRELDQDAWINLALKKINNIDNAVVVDDCRYPNEYDKLKASGFTIIRVVAPLNLRRERLQANGKYGGEEAFNHKSETAIDHLPADYTIINDGNYSLNQIATLVGNIVSVNL